MTESSRQCSFISAFFIGREILILPWVRITLGDSWRGIRIVAFSSQRITNISFSVIDLGTRRSEIPTSYKFILFFAVAKTSAYGLLVATVSLTEALLGVLTGNTAARFWFFTLGSTCRVTPRLPFTLQLSSSNNRVPVAWCGGSRRNFCSLVFSAGPSIQGSLFFLCGCLLLMGAIDMLSLFCVFPCIGLSAIGHFCS